MPIDPKRSVLSDLRKPLIQPGEGIPAGLEERLLGPVLQTKVQENDLGQEANSSRTNGGSRQRKERVPTVPVTFHLPVELRDRVKITAQAKQKTMLEVALEALTDYLDKNPVSEADIRRLLGV